MAECTHSWIGTASGVVCIKCGKELTQKEYAESLKPKAPKPQKPKTTKPKA